MYFPDGKEPPTEDVMNYSLTVPDEVREHFIYLQQSFHTYIAFMKHPEWALYSKSSDKLTRPYSRISDNNLLCLKSISVCRGEVQQILDALTNFDMKALYDDTVEGGKFIYSNLPYETNVVYQKHKKILVVSPRDFILIARIHRVSKEEAYVITKSITIPSQPVNKNIVRASTSLGGWRVKVKEPGSGGKKPLCKLTFFSEIDFKISLFISKTVGPKTGHLA